MKLKEVYLYWQIALPHIAKAKRMTIVARTDTALLDVLEHAFQAEYLTGYRKIDAVEYALSRLDTAKFFLLVAWQGDALTRAQYIQLSKGLVEVSKMLVGWLGYLQKKTPAEDGRK